MKSTKLFGFVLGAALIATPAIAYADYPKPPASVSYLADDPPPPPPAGCAPDSTDPTCQPPPPPPQPYCARFWRIEGRC
jgi:hypothetical protein